MRRTTCAGAELCQRILQNALSLKLRVHHIAKVVIFLHATRVERIRLMGQTAGMNLFSSLIVMSVIGIMWTGMSCIDYIYDDKSGPLVISSAGTILMLLQIIVKRILRARYNSHFDRYGDSFKSDPRVRSGLIWDIMYCSPSIVVFSIAALSLVFHVGRLSDLRFAGFIIGVFVALFRIAIFLVYREWGRPGYWIIGIINSGVFIASLISAFIAVGGGGA